MDDGYISFTPDQLREEAAKNPNSEAYEWLDKAMLTSSNITKKDKKGDG